MAYDITFDPRPGFLHVRVTGENSRDAVRGYLADVRRACLEYDRAMVLIEEDLAGPSLSVLDVYQVVTGAIADAIGTIRRIAYVDLNPEHLADRMRFAETVAVNRGLEVRVYGRPEEAEEWLLEA